MHTNLIILAGGASSRMKKSLATSNLSEEEITAANINSKALIGLGKRNQPILDYLLYNAEKAGYRNVYLVVGKQGNAFRDYYANMQNHSFKELKLRYATQHIPTGRTKPFGTADALTQALEQYPQLQHETFTVCNSDNLYSITALTVLRKTETSNAFISYDRDGLLFNTERISKFALAQLNVENYLIDIIEKPSIEEMPKYKGSDDKFRVSMNIFKLSGSEVYPFLKNCPVHPQRDEKELPTAVLNMCTSNPKALKGIPVKEHVPDLTSKEDILTLKKYISNHYHNC